MLKNKSSYDGFTLIELLIVIAIIGILAAVLIPNLLSAQKKAKDAQVKTALKAMVSQSQLFTGPANLATVNGFCARTTATGYAPTKANTLFEGGSIVALNALGQPAPALPAQTTLTTAATAVANGKTNNSFGAILNPLLSSSGLGLYASADSNCYQEANSTPATGGAWSVVMRLPSTPITATSGGITKFFCVDSTGAAKENTSTSSGLNTYASDTTVIDSVTFMCK